MKHSDRPGIWRLAGPLILSNISVALLGIVDTAVVGHLDEPYYLGAVAIAAVVFNFLYWSMGFLRMGTTALVAHVHGEGDNDEIRTVLLHAGMIALGIASLLLLLQGFIARTGFHLLGGSEEVIRYARVYFYCAIWGAPAVLVSMALFGWLLGMQNARATLVFAIVQNLVNIILDFLLVFGLDMGVKGVALASVIAQYCGLFLGVFLVRRELADYPGAWKRKSIANLERLRQMLILNQNIFIRTICLILVFAFFAREGALQGDVILAANAVLLNFQAITALGLDGFANATEALVGRAIGARDRAAFSRAVGSALYWSLVVAAIFTLAYWITGETIIGLMTSLDDVRAAAARYLPWLILSPLVSIWCFLLDGIFIGAARGKEMRNSMLVSTFLVFLPAWYLATGLGNHGLWLAFLLFFAARGVTLGAYYFHIAKQRDGFVFSA